MGVKNRHTILAAQVRDRIREMVMQVPEVFEIRIVKVVLNCKLVRISASTHTKCGVQRNREIDQR